MHSSSYSLRILLAQSRYLFAQNLMATVSSKTRSKEFAEEHKIAVKNDESFQCRFCCCDDWDSVLGLGGT